jgi:hypothetical protein
MSLLSRDPAKTNTNATRRLILILALFLFIVALALIIIQSVGGSPKLLRTYSDGYVDGFKKARAFAIERMPNLAGQRSLYGTVTAVGADSVTVKAENMFVDESVDGVGDTRTIKIAAGTKIVKSQQLSPEETQKSRSEFEAQLRAYDAKSETPPPVPSPMTKDIELALKDISVGDHIAVVSADGAEDISTVKTITAGKITVMKVEE